MEKIIVVVFDSELKAIEGLEALRELDRNNEISLYEAQIISKGSSGAVSVVESKDALAFPLIWGAGVVGGLIGILGGPLGVAAGASLGGLIGSLGDLKEEGVTEEFVNDVKIAVAPDKSAVVADLDEWVHESVATRMKKLGGVLLRCHIRDAVEQGEKDFDAAAHRAEIDQLNLERAQVRREDLAKIDAKIDHLRGKLENAIEGRRVKMQLRREQREAKIKALQEKAARSKGEIQRRQQARIAELRQDYSAKTKAG